MVQTRRDQARDASDLLALIDLAEHQVERIDTLGWQFPLKLATAVVVAAGVAVPLAAAFHRSYSESAIAFASLVVPAALWLTYHWRSRVRDEQRAESRAVLAAHEYITVLASSLPTLPEKQLRLRLARLPIYDEVPSPQSDGHFSGHDPKTGTTPTPGR